MADVSVRNLDDAVVQRWKQRARSNGRSLEQELRLLITTAAPVDRQEALTRMASIRAATAQVPQDDSTALIRADRDAG